MTMPGASISSHDSVEKDFAKLKVDKDLVGQEDNSSVPMSQDSVDAATDLTPREFFRIWCTVYDKVYPNEHEEERRFQVFQQSLDSTIPSGVSVHASNFPGFADRTIEELEVISDFNKHECYSSISRQELIAFKDYVPILPPIPEDFPKVDAETDLTPREAFKIWCYMYGKLYSDEEEEEFRFHLFEKSIAKTIPPGCVTNYPNFADATKEEFDEFEEYMERDCYSSVSLQELKAYALHLGLIRTHAIFGLRSQSS